MEGFSEIVVCIENINKRIVKIKRDKTAEFGLKNAHFSCMLHIDITADGLTSTEIARVCNVDKAFVSRITSDLIGGGYICTNQKFNDGRKYRNKYILTEAGKRVIKDVNKAITDYFVGLSLRIEKDDLDGFIKTIVAVNDMIEDQNEE